MDKKPQITVLMCVYNGEEFLCQSIESILNQSLKEFEFLIINDCSLDSTLSILNSYKDSRIKIISNGINLGLTKSLNIGLRLAQGKYIARMDADDIAFENRLEKQFQFMEQNPEVGVLGSNALSNGRYFKYKTKLPEKDFLIKWNLFFSNPIIHPGTMYRKDLVLSVGAYNEEKKVGQDYDLWTRLASKTKFANLYHPYLFLRRHKNNISVKASENQHLMAIETIKCFLADVTNKNYSDEEMEPFFFQNFRNIKDRQKTIQIISELYDIFINKFQLSEPEKIVIYKDKNRRIFRIKHPIWSKIAALLEF